jgi:hypothetical protein
MMFVTFYLKILWKLQNSMFLKGPLFLIMNFLQLKSFVFLTIPLCISKGIYNFKAHPVRIINFTILKRSQIDIKLS